MLEPFIDRVKAPLRAVADAESTLQVSFHHLNDSPNLEEEEEEVRPHGRG